MTSPHTEPTGRRFTAAAQFCRALAWFCACAMWGWVLFAWLAPELDDSGRAGAVFNWFAFAARTFLLHVSLGGLVVAVVFAICRAWKPALLLALATAPSMVAASSAFLPRASPPNTPVSFTVMSSNLLVRSESERWLIELVMREKPDVLLIQECTHDSLATLTEALREMYPVIIAEPRDHAFGMATFSRFALAGRDSERDRETPELDDPTRPQLRVVLRVPRGEEEAEVLVQNVHTMPPVGASTLAGQRQLLRELAHVQRAETRPTVLAGDLNSGYETHGLLRKVGLRDAWRDRGSGLGGTWPSNGVFGFLPGFRIDHIHTANGLVCHDIRVCEDIGSDHRPIVARLGLVPAAAPAKPAAARP